MNQSSSWVSANKIEEHLGIDRKTLFTYRDNGMLKLGPHYAAFPETRSRNGYRWNVKAIEKHLEKQKKLSVVS